jgi:hypothetical protein
VVSGALLDGLPGSCDSLTRGHRFRCLCRGPLRERRPDEREGKVESILEMIQGLITKFFGSSAMAVIQSFIDKIIGLLGSIFGSLKPATG